jgi:hypothetical protein
MILNPNFYTVKTCLALSLDDCLPLLYVRVSGRAAIVNLSLPTKLVDFT